MIFFLTSMSAKGCAVPGHIGCFHVHKVNIHPFRRDAQVFVEQSTQQFRVLPVGSTADLANAVEEAECAGVSLPSKHHHLVRVDVHGYVLVCTGQKHKTVQTINQ